MGREVGPSSHPAAWRLWDDRLLYLGSRAELANEKLAKTESVCFNFLFCIGV